MDLSIRSRGVPWYNFHKGRGALYEGERGWQHPQRDPTPPSGYAGTERYRSVVRNTRWAKHAVVCARTARHVHTTTTTTRPTPSHLPPPILHAPPPLLAPSKPPNVCRARGRVWCDEERGSTGQGSVALAPVGADNGSPHSVGRGVGGCAGSGGVASGGGGVRGAGGGGRFLALGAPATAQDFCPVLPPSERDLPPSSPTFSFTHRKRLLPAKKKRKRRSSAAVAAKH